MATYIMSFTTSGVAGEVKTRRLPPLLDGLAGSVAGAVGFMWYTQACVSLSTLLVLIWSSGEYLVWPASCP